MRSWDWFPGGKESGGKSRIGHINRQSRKLTRTILSQSIYHVSNSSPYLRKFYRELTEKRGCGRARIALIQKVCSIMRRMLMTGEEFCWIEHRCQKPMKVIAVITDPAQVLKVLRHFITKARHRSVSIPPP